MCAMKTTVISVLGEFVHKGLDHALKADIGRPNLLRNRFLR